LGFQHTHQQKNADEGNQRDDDDPQHLRFRSCFCEEIR
jgi:hypothetical protein